MKSKLLLSAMFLFLLVGLYTPASYSAVTYNITLANDVYTAPNVYEFDIFLAKTGTGTLRLCAIQFDISYNAAILNGGTPTFTEVYTSDTDGNILTYSWDDIMANNEPTTTATQGTNELLIASIAYPLRNSAAVIPVAPGVCVGRYRITNTQPFSGQNANLAFKFDGYGTICLAYLAGAGNNTTTPIVGTTDYSNWNNPLLPVELSSFASAAQGLTVLLTWSTKTEKNSDRFEIERSLVTNTTWSTVGTVKASVLSNSVKNYSYTDTKLQSGKYQYRLKMVDNDGSFSYSSVEAAVVAVPKDFTVSQNYPNPFNPSTKIDYQVPVDSKVIMDVYNIAGQKVMELVNQEQSAGYYTVDFGASKLSSGVYIYRLAASDKAIGNNFSSIKKMTLLK
jgi:hypothetical protein